MVIFYFILRLLGAKCVAPSIAHCSYVSVIIPFPVRLAEMASYCKY